MVRQGLRKAVGMQGQKQRCCRVCRMTGGKQSVEETTNRMWPRAGSELAARTHQGQAEFAMDSSTIIEPFCQCCLQALLNFKWHGVILIKKSWSTASLPGPKLCPTSSIPRRDCRPSENRRQGLPLPLGQAAVDSWPGRKTLMLFPHQRKELNSGIRTLGFQPSPAADYLDKPEQICGVAWASVLSFTKWDQWQT